MKADRVLLDSAARSAAAEGAKRNLRFRLRDRGFIERWKDYAREKLRTAA
jgi:hypothetical protein